MRWIDKTGSDDMGEEHTRLCGSVQAWRPCGGSAPAYAVTPGAGQLVQVTRRPRLAPRVGWAAGDKPLASHSGRVYRPCGGPARDLGGLAGSEPARGGGGL